MLFPCLAIFLCIAAFLTFRSRYTAQKDAARTENFWERENEANSTPRRDISNLDYIKIPEELLPFCRLSDDEQLNQCEAPLVDLSDKKILNLIGKTNTELKKEYGAPNLPLLMEYDENFTILIRTLNQLGYRLKELGLTQEARTTYAFAVSIGSDITDTYVQLALLYKKDANAAKLRELETKASALQSDSRKRILEKLNLIK
ncbi:hypothetical protein [Eubacterium oxidoreducens]|uniref:Uncharacterized protein n=1 Tax=Eubacterium oxidoreducens TaxID=1732 RepID=A0A1G6CDY6_EUBOX|nr:hypothetical protein [Eubacterium oxidoreducens]SDB31077.1 hypothetical protein SAMN02910417_02305 [Eubacterium oxidoreducens]